MTFLPPYDVDPNPTADTVKEGVMKNDGNIGDVYDNLNSLLAMIELIPATGEQILAALLPVDGQGSGLDAEYLGGRIYSEYGLAVHTHPVATHATHGFMDLLDKQKLDGIQDAAEQNVQSDWAQTDSSNDAYIRSKPKIIGTIGTIALGDTAVFTGPVTLEGKSVLEMKNHFGFYQEQDFIASSTGLPDGGKPVKLNTLGQIDASMIDVSVFHYIGVFTPVAGTEYPDTTGETHGAFWIVQGVDETNGYTFTGGDLAGLTIDNGDFMVWGADGWSIMAGEMSPMLYYKLDGTQPLTDHFRAGNYQLKDVADGTDAQDAVTKAQLDTRVAKSGDAMSGTLYFDDSTSVVFNSNDGKDSIFSYSGLTLGRPACYVKAKEHNMSTLYIGGATVGDSDWYSVRIRCVGSFTVNDHNIWHANNLDPTDFLSLSTGGELQTDFGIFNASLDVRTLMNKPDATAGWARGMRFFDYNGVKFGALGAYGAGPDLNCIFIGMGDDAYSTGLRITPDKIAFIGNDRIYTDDYHPAIADLLTEINQLKQRITALEEA